jgi:serine/threonine-protein kinase
MTAEPPGPVAGNEPTTESWAQFGQYRLLGLLGRGGMGEVWRAYDTVTDRHVALKVLLEHFAEDEKFQRRFRREAHAAAQLNNAHIIPIHTFGEIQGHLFVDMRLIEGRDLQAVLFDGPLEPARAVQIVGQVAKGLHAAHKVGLVHRDVKPSNILLDEDDHAYLIDFGIARASTDTTLTGAGAFVGSWHYMAPERFAAGPADARADVYALACVLFECLTGQTPYPGDDLEQQYASHRSLPPPRPTSVSPGLPAAFDNVIDLGMAKNPDERYATTVELARAAHDASNSEPISSTEPNAAPTIVEPPTVRSTAETQQSTQAADLPDNFRPAPRSRRRRRIPIVAKALAVLLLVGVGAPLMALNQSLDSSMRHSPAFYVGLALIYVAGICVAISLVVLTVRWLRPIVANRRKHSVLRRNSR